MMTIRHLMTTTLAASLFATAASANVTIDYSDLTLSADSYYNGSDQAGGFTSQGVHFSNDYNAAWQSWSGFAYSNVDDTETESIGSQYAAFTGSAQSGDIYAVGYGSSAVVSLPIATTVSGAYFTNTTYAAMSMIEGDAFAKQFTAEDEDWFRLTVYGLDAGGNNVGSVDLYLADFRASDPEDHYILETWEWADLTSLGEVSALTFSFASSDVGDFGMNTPAYFAMDGLTLAAIPEPGTFALLAAGSLLVMRRRRAQRARA
ncbi:DUF4465 domain-containing protein [Phycisphaerales bacterium AB-hyl4]|uniref:DUF4465 domain-containing protein n=1 Tax=Natronomicrosphaera hydrolytica TaxID=3242702 RepID=A0ABV4U998_9BACT